MAKSFVLSVGGSLLVTEKGIEADFLKKFCAFILGRSKRGDKFYLVIGGGATARNYIAAATATAKILRSDQDWVGIAATRLNAELVRAVFGPAAYPNIIFYPTKPVKTAKKIIIVAGYQPGRSTDYVAVLLAQKYKIETVVNLSNIDYVYDKDPRRFSAARRIEAISWPEFRKIVGHKWRPGLNAPFDPIAARLAAEKGLKVVVINGKKIKNLSACLAGKKYVGTRIGE
jgi:uridylate kinase